jgi:hypothetical protein
MQQKQLALQQQMQHKQLALQQKQLAVRLHRWYHFRIG